MPYRLAAKMSYGREGMMNPEFARHPFFVVGLIVHIAFAILVFLILLFLAMYLWEKVEEQKYKNAELGKKRRS